MCIEKSSLYTHNKSYEVWSVPYLDTQCSRPVGSTTPLNSQNRDVPFGQFHPSVPSPRIRCLVFHLGWLLLAGLSLEFVFCNCALFLQCHMDRFEPVNWNHIPPTCSIDSEGFVTMLNYFEWSFIWFLKRSTVGIALKKNHFACCKLWGTEVGEGPCWDVGMVTSERTFSCNCRRCWLVSWVSWHRKKSHLALRGKHRRPSPPQNSLSLP